MTGSIALARAHFPVTSLGFGRRIGIWMQGCSIRCAGCIVPESWVAQREHRVSLPALFCAIEPWLDEADGVTISGGEPFDQPNALETLLRGLRTRSSGDLLVYSGYPERHLRRHHAALLELVDAAIVEPFRRDSPDSRPFIGSTNQRFLTFTALGRTRNALAARAPRRRDVAISAGAILMAGVPRVGELDELVAALNAAGCDARGPYDAV